MFLRSKTGGFFLRLVVVYGVLAYPWPWLLDAYTAAYRTIGNGALGSFGAEGTVRFKPLPDGGKMLDTAIVLGSRRSRLTATTKHSARLTGYLPTVEVLALTLATPIPWRRRWRALLWGMILVNAFVGLRTALVPLYGFCESGWGQLYAPGPFWRTVLDASFNIGVKWASLSFVAPVFIWIVATFRAKDIRRWIATYTTDSSRAAEPTER